MSAEKFVIMMLLMSIIIGAMVAAFYTPHPLKSPSGHWPIMRSTPAGP